MSKISSLIFTFLLLLYVHSEQECCSKNIISIVGAGVTEVDPDIAVFYISASANGNTSLQALSNVNNITSQAENILQAANNPDVNITTAYIYLYPVYNYSNGTSYIIGQQASVGIKVVVGNLNSNKQLLGNIASNLSTINNISLSGFSFQNSDTSSALRLARGAAVADAQAKFQQYTALIGKNNYCVASIFDQNVERYIPFDISPGYYSFRQRILDVPYGKVRVYANVQIKWKLHG